MCNKSISILVVFRAGVALILPASQAVAFPVDEGSLE